MDGWKVSVLQFSVVVDERWNGKCSRNVKRPKHRRDHNRRRSKLSTLKPLHAAAVIKVYNFFKTDEGKKIVLSGWQAAGITEALKKARESNTIPSISLNPYE